MFVFEITVPGTWLEHDDGDWAFQVQNLLRHLQSQFIEANVALNLFTEAVGRPPASFDRESWGTDSECRRDIERAIEAQRSEAGAPEDLEAVRFEADVCFKREQWSTGRMPREFEHNVPFLYARAFLYALDMFDKSLGALSEIDGIPVGVSNLHAQMSAAFPNLRGVRNSIQHLEDRMRGRGRTGEAIDLKPIKNDMVRAPGGGVLVLNSLNGTMYGSTMADGRYGEVDVSPESMIKLQQILQGVLDCFTWTGPKQHEPNV